MSLEAVLGLLEFANLEKEQVMPLIDLPLAKLKRYRGRNPKPADF